MGKGGHNDNRAAPGGVRRKTPRASNIREIGSTVAVPPELDPVAEPPPLLSRERKRASTDNALENENGPESQASA